MTNAAGMLDREIIEHLIAVLRMLIRLLSRFDEPASAEWLAGHLATIDDPSASPQAISKSVHDVHQVVLGMGGLMDLRLSAASPGETIEANEELERLADQLFELTR